MTQQQLDSLNVGDIVMYVSIEGVHVQRTHGFVRAISSARNIVFVQYFHDATLHPSISWANVKKWHIVSK